jgi:hypothetical protein
MTARTARVGKRLLRHPGDKAFSMIAFSVVVCCQIDAASVEQPRGPGQQRLAALAEGGDEGPERLPSRQERLITIDS